MFALPALAALRETYPDASITRLGRPWQATLLGGRPGAVDAVRVLPTVRGVGAPAFVDAVPVEAVRDQALALLAEVLTSRSSASSSTA